MTESFPKSPPEAETGTERRGLGKRIADWLFGRDFFISYRWEDGRQYAVKLAKKLRADRFDCFLDSDGYLKGDNWRKIGERELRKTNRLVLVGSPKSHESGPVARELKIFQATGRRVFAIEFGDSLAPAKYPKSLILPHLDPSAIRQVEASGGWESDPSQGLVDELRRTFSGEATAKRRLRAIRLTAAILLLLTVLASITAGLAYRQYRQILVASALADSQRAAAEIETPNLDLATGYLIRSLERNPQDASVSAMLFQQAVRHPPTVPIRLATGQFPDARISENGGLVVLRSIEGEVHFQRAGGDLTVLETGGRPIEALYLDGTDGWLGLVADGECGLVSLNSANEASLLWWPFTATVSALAAGNGSLVVGDTNGEVHRFDPGHPPVKLSMLAEAEGGIKAVAWVGDPAEVAAATDDGWWQIGNREAHFPEMAEAGLPVCFTSAGFVWSAARDPGDSENIPFTQILGYDGLATESPDPAIMSPGWNRVEAVDLRADNGGQRCILLSKNNELFLTPRSPEAPLQLSRGGVLAADLSPEGSRIVTAHVDGSLRCWESSYLVATHHPIWAPPEVLDVRVTKEAEKVLITNENGVWLTGFQPLDTEKLEYGRPTKATKLSAGFRKLDPMSRWRRARDGSRVSRLESSESAEGQWIFRSGNNEHTFDYPMEAIDPDTVMEASSFAFFPTTIAALSANGKILATAAGPRPIRLWCTRTGNQMTQLDMEDDTFPLLLGLSENGDRILSVHITESGDQQSYSIAPTSGSGPSTKVRLYAGERLWDISPDLKQILVGTNEQLSVLDTETRQVVNGPVSLNYMIWKAGYTSDGAGFFLATRDGRFRIWRSVDATPLCPTMTFDQDAPDFNGDPMDIYHFSIWEEAHESGIRRVAFRTESGDHLESGVQPPFEIFEIGPAGSDDDREQFARMMGEIYGVSLSEAGTLERRPPVPSRELRGRYASENAWDESDFRSLAEWLLASPDQRSPAPLGDDRKSRGAR